MPYETVRDFCAFLAAEIETDRPLAGVLPVGGDDEYAPPELVEFEHMGERGRVYQAAQLLLELLTHEAAGPDPVIPADIPEPLREVFHRALARNFEDRPRNVKALLRELRSVLPQLDPLRRAWAIVLERWRQSPDDRSLEEALIDAVAVTGQWDELLDALDDRTVSHRTPVLWLRARVLHDFKRDPAAAEEVLLELVAMGNRDGLGKLAGLYRYQERWRDLESLLANHATDFDLLVELGKLQATLGLRRRAMRTLRSALTRRPDDPRAAIPLARLRRGPSHPALARPRRRHVLLLAGLVMGTVVALGAGVALSDNSHDDEALVTTTVVAPRLVESSEDIAAPKAAPEAAPAPEPAAPVEMTIALDEAQLVESASLRPIAVAGATFTMGRPGGGAYGELRPHEVSFTRSFEMMPTEVTRREWAEVTGTHPAGEDCPNCPVTLVSWFEAAHYANALSKRDGLTACYTMEGCRGQDELGIGCGAGTLDCGGGFQCKRVSQTAKDCEGYRLPTEAEWEFVARHSGANAEKAWYASNSRGQLQPVGGLDADDYGVHDILGNAWEWTWDNYDIYPLEAQLDPQGPGPGDRRRIYRGGAFNSFSQRLDPTFRNKAGPAFRTDVLGFRLVRSLSQVGAR
jgi:formylglycine-generating enzyme required for sulfatase activity